MPYGLWGNAGNMRLPAAHEQVSGRNVASVYLQQCNRPSAVLPTLPLVSDLALGRTVAAMRNTSDCFTTMLSGCEPREFTGCVCYSRAHADGLINGSRVSKQMANNGSRMQTCAPPDATGISGTGDDCRPPALTSFRDFGANILNKRRVVTALKPY